MSEGEIGDLAREHEEKAATDALDALAERVGARAILDALRSRRPDQARLCVTCGGIIEEPPLRGRGRPLIRCAACRQTDS